MIILLPHRKYTNMNEEIFYHDGSELQPGWYIHTNDGALGPYETEQLAADWLNMIESQKTEADIPVKVSKED